MPAETTHVVHTLLKAMPERGLEPAKELFWSRLGYSRVNDPLSTREWPERAWAALPGLPTEGTGHAEHL